ncbi:MAG TPA: hypothetical protein VKP65_04885 [Rhodothermales bacterium]|nr:hypothetical protein [Rhodothermales bacterium]
MHTPSRISDQDETVDLGTMHGFILTVQHRSQKRHRSAIPSSSPGYE